MKLLFLAAAERIISDSRTGKISAIDLIEEVTSVQFPFLVMSPFIVATFEKENDDEEESQGELIFKNDDEEIVRSNFTISFGGLKRARSIIELNAMIIPKPGHLSISVRVNDIHLRDWDILVSQISDTVENTAIVS